MSNTMVENKGKCLAIILIDLDLRSKMEILVKLLLLFPIIVFPMIKHLVIYLFIKILAQINILKKIPNLGELFFNY